MMKEIWKDVASNVVCVRVKGPQCHFVSWNFDILPITVTDLGSSIRTIQGPTVHAPDNELGFRTPTLTVVEKQY
ncbi:unnamed protein product [Fusarium graminearum]|nr:unnamed protein product [Fusarium graminearum]